MNGEVQSASTTTPSIWQLKRPGSGEEKAKLGLRVVDEPSPRPGPEVIARPILQVRVSAGPMFPAWSVALTWKLCEPAGEPGGGVGRGAGGKAAGVELAAEAGAGLVRGEAERRARIGRGRAVGGPGGDRHRGAPWCRR